MTDLHTTIHTSDAPKPGGTVKDWVRVRQLEEEVERLTHDLEFEKSCNRKIGDQHNKTLAWLQDIQLDHAKEVKEIKAQQPHEIPTADPASMVCAGIVGLIVGCLVAIASGVIPG